MIIRPAEYALVSRNLNSPVTDEEVHYRVTHQVVASLPLTSKQQFHFGMPWPGLAKSKQNFCYGWFQWEVRHNLMCHPVDI